MKPDCHTAMRLLLAQIRQALPFEMDEAQLCRGPCQGCSKKLLEFIDMELEEWQTRLDRGEQPSLGDIQKLAKRARKVYQVMQNNGLIEIVNPD
ncbi:hypothetical protein [Motiliproteus sp.]|uniref:hypothetical protein n=1 Tax=Motiliproteus sp. TaxID=1898955 RepID=UPI003BAB9349